MLSSTIKEFMRAMPFVPFVVQMTDGRQFKVEHPDFVSISPQGSKLIVYDHDDHEVHLSGLLVASVEPLRGRKSRTPGRS
jgi:hypothetical protein